MVPFGAVNKCSFSEQLWSHFSGNELTPSNNTFFVGYPGLKGERGNNGSPGGSGINGLPGMECVDTHQSSAGVEYYCV
jgi:hypothetical protein